MACKFGDSLGQGIKYRLDRVPLSPSWFKIFSFLGS